MQRASASAAASAGADFVNHITLDSTNAFEGPEKLLEIWFALGKDKLPPGWPVNGLRSIPLRDIEDLLSTVNCSILSKVSAGDLDAYLLSESSLFVFPHQIVLKTCGTTTTLRCLPKLLELVQKHCHYNKPNLMQVPRVFYSRRSYLFPNRQDEIHRSWTNEVQWLNKFFPAETATAYEVGDLTRDHWHLYINGTVEERGDEVVEDQTVELLMTELEPTNAAKFTMGHCKISQDISQDIGHSLGANIMKQSHLNELAPTALKHDAFAFTPCGFSSNSIDGRHYATLHVTPEQGWSYASFETNFPQGSMVIEDALKMLKPGRFCVSYVESSAEAAEAAAVTAGASKTTDPAGASVAAASVTVSGSALDRLHEIAFPGYERCERIVYDLRFGYRMLYLSFRRTN